MRILLTRPEADARRSAQRLAALGHDVVIVPLFEIVATGALQPDGAFTRLLATSAHAFDVSHDTNDLKALRLDVVGARTAAAARESGFSRVETAAPDAKSLAIAIARENALPQDFLYLAGRERHPDLEAALGALGHRVTPWLVYAARETDTAAAQLNELWQEQRIDAVLHFSPRSAALYVALAEKAGLTAAALAPLQIAISPRAARQLAGARLLRTATTPDFAGLLAQV
jgi:uroporphyrinogen-III synthase